MFHLLVFQQSILSYLWICVNPCGLKILKARKRKKKEKKRKALMYSHWSLKCFILHQHCFSFQMILLFALNIHQYVLSIVVLRKMWNSLADQNCESEHFRTRGSHFYDLYKTKHTQLCFCSDWCDVLISWRKITEIEVPNNGLSTFM